MPDDELSHPAGNELSAVPSDSPDGKAVAAPAGEGSDDGEDAQFRPPEYNELSPEQAAQETAVAAATLHRIERMAWVAGAVCALAALWPLGWQISLGIALGTLLGWINGLVDAGHIETALLFATLKGLPGKMYPSMTAHWVEHGAIAQLKEAA